MKCRVSFLLSPIFPSKSQRPLLAPHRAFNEYREVGLGHTFDALSECGDDGARADEWSRRKRDRHHRRTRTRRFEHEATKLRRCGQQLEVAVIEHPFPIE